MTDTDKSGPRDYEVAVVVVTADNARSVSDRAEDMTTVSDGLTEYDASNLAQELTRRIASQPDLLEACKLLLANLWDNRPKPEIRRDYHLLVAQEAAKTAIAKAGE